MSVLSGLRSWVDQLVSVATSASLSSSSGIRQGHHVAAKIRNALADTANAALVNGQQHDALVGRRETAGSSQMQRADGVVVEDVR
jgi:hypothetical protein